MKKWRQIPENIFHQWKKWRQIPENVFSPMKQKWMQIWDPKKIKNQKFSKSKSVLPKLSARFFYAGERRPRPIWGPPGPFLRGLEKSKNCSNLVYFPWWAHGPTKENRPNLNNFWIFPAHAKMAREGPKWGGDAFLRHKKTSPTIWAERILILRTFDF